MINVLLWDVDGTLLDFKAAERNAMQECYAHFGLGELTQERIAIYSEINHKYWRMLEDGLKTKDQILRERFEEFFALDGVSCDADAFNEVYQLQLGETICFRDNAYGLLKGLRGKVKQYAVTNGTFVAQQRKLSKSGLIDLFDDVFISDQIGTEKPGIAFFEHVFSAIGPYPKNEMMIIGDSLTSDIQGGNTAGIQCCWYNPGNQPRPDHLRIDYEIQNLNEVLGILSTGV